MLLASIAQPRAPHHYFVLTKSFSVAGSETTASSLSALTNNLLRHPEIYAKVKQEVRSAFSSEDQIKLEAVMNLPYLTACIEEGLRIFPPAPIGFLREIQAQGDVIDGYELPGGVSSPANLHLDFVHYVVLRERLTNASTIDGRISLILVRPPYIPKLHRPRLFHPRTMARRQ